MKVLLTGFEPFADVDVNPSQQVVEALSQQQVKGIHLAHAILPVEYDLAGKQIRQLIYAHEPDVVLMLGVARGRDKINLERIAVNVDDSETPDNAGEVRNGHPVVWHTSPIAYLSTLPIIPMIEMLAEKGLPAKISNHAGTFVCNHVFYMASHEFDRINAYVPCGFIHLPPVSEDYTLEMMIEAIRTCIELLLEIDV